MKVLLDMNLPPRWGAFLRSHGHDAVHWSEVGDLRATDRKIMAWAAGHDHVVFSHDLDFSALLAATASTRPSVIQIRCEDVTPESSGGLLVDSIERFEQELRAGALLVIEPARVRVRLLPLRGN